MRSLRRMAIVVVFFAAGCGATAETEIELLVESRVAGVDRIRVEVTHPDGDESTSDADLSETPGPRRLVLRHRGGELGPIRLRVRGLAGEEVRASATRLLAFETGRTLRLEVVLAAECAGLECGEATCGNDGRCRPPQVADCELAVGGCVETRNDAGAADASTLDSGPDAGADASPSDGGADGAVDAGLDAGACAGFSLCGVDEVHLPGDRIAPRVCAGAVAGTLVEVLHEGATLPVVDGAAFVSRPGAYRARLTAGECEAELGFSVAGPTAYDLRDETGVLREIDGRVDSAVLVASDGAYVMDGSGHARVVGDAVTPGVHRDYSAVAYTSAGAWLGATGGHREYVFIGSPVRTGVPVAQALTDPLRGALRMALPVGRESPILYASSQGPAFLNSPTDPGSVLDTRGVTWLAYGALAEEGRGAVWTGNGTGVRNLATDSRSSAFAGAVMSFEGALTTVQTAQLDESAGVTSLWACGREVHRYDFVGNLSAATELPEPAVRVEEDCLDLNVGDAGEVWFTRRTGGVIRLAQDGTELLRFGRPQGLLGNTVFLRLDFASDATGRSLWLLSVPDRSVVRYSARAPGL